MESPDLYNFSLFTPRNLHGKKNRNVIFSMLAIWAVAVFGFQFLLRLVEKPTPEKSLVAFESTWPSGTSAEIKSVDYKTILHSLVLVRGKNTVNPDDQRILSEAISCTFFTLVPDSIRNLIIENISEIKSLKAKLTESRDKEYLDLKITITEKNKNIASLGEFYSGFKPGSLESTILISTLQDKFPDSLTDESFKGLPGIMKLYLTHNRSFLTDTKFLGFPFHYFYTAVFLLILFVSLCIIYNILIEWRLNKQGIVE
jgi:uncharacterized membrane protein